MKTIKTLNKELQQIRRARKSGKYETGMFGFKACKESIKWERDNLHKSLERQYTEFMYRALTEIGFNTFMIIACEEMMNSEAE